MTNVRSRTRYTLLGMLSIEPQTGYNIAKMIRVSTSFFWSESEGQIYPELARLVEEKLVQCEDLTPEGKGRQKKLYSITTKGRKELASWLMDVPHKTLIRNELLLKLFFSDNVGSEVAIKHLIDFKTKVVSQLEMLDSIYKNEVATDMSSSHAKYWLITMDYGLELARAQLKWCEKALAKLRAKS